MNSFDDGYRSGYRDGLSAAAQELRAMADDAAKRAVLYRELYPQPNDSELISGALRLAAQTLTPKV